MIHLLRVCEKQGLRSECRRGGMADAADSKSVNGDIVRVQVPQQNENRLYKMRTILFYCAIFIKIPH